MKRRNLMKIKKWADRLGEIINDNPPQDSSEYLAQARLYGLQRDMEDMVRTGTLDRLDKGTRSEKG